MSDFRGDFERVPHGASEHIETFHVCFPQTELDDLKYPIQASWVREQPERPQVWHKSQVAGGSQG